MRIKIKTTLAGLGLGLLLCLTAAGRADGDRFFEIRGGIAWITDKTRVEVPDLTVGNTIIGKQNSYGVIGVPWFDLLFGWTTEPFQSVIRLNISLSGSNSVFYRNDAKPAKGSPFDLLLKSSKFRTKNYGLSFTEYLPLSLFKDGLILSPCLDLKFGHYLDPSAGQEFTRTVVKPASDHWFSFLNLGLKAQANIGDWNVICEYKYPVFGLLTDSWTRDNRREQQFWACVKWNPDKLYLSAGFEYTVFDFSNKVFTAFKESYLQKTSAALLLTAGVNF